jgi:deoxyribodipyrimidine photo-lyase
MLVSPRMRCALNIVWFKKDLRITDHEPLTRSLANGPTIGLFVIEPSMLQQPDSSSLHWNFILASLQELQQRLATINVALWVATAEVVDVLKHLATGTGIARLWSHQETGNRVSYERDKAVARWVRQADIQWTEFASGGVRRPHRSRDGWAAHWQLAMAHAVLPSPSVQTLAPVVTMEGNPVGLTERIPTNAAELGMTELGHVNDLRPGQAAASEVLTSFCQQRGRNYLASVSSPSHSWTGSSRLSPYLAYGCISLRTVVQAINVRIALAESEGDAEFVRSLAAMRSRLAWHCHFIQKLEDEPRYEEQNIHKAHNGLRCEAIEQLSAREQRLLRAWRAGHTGFPLIDAVMRCLLATGWINFRMRAMLVSFASYDLWLHWRPVALHLARNFIDYDPGIHYPQVQMQAGTTGSNALRMYDPRKQQHDHDPTGEFVKTWVPQLAPLPVDHVAAPWQVPRGLQQHYGVVIGRDYPAPIVDHVAAIRHAKQAFAAIRSGTGFRQETAALVHKHGSRKGRS